MRRRRLVSTWLAPGREPDAPGPGETIVVPVDATLMGLRAAPNPAVGLDGRLRPRVRSGWALKRLAADEGDERFVLRDLEGGSFVRMDADDAALFELLDGNRTVAELLERGRAAGRTGGPRAARAADRRSRRPRAARWRWCGAGAGGGARECAGEAAEAARPDGDVGGRLLRARLPPLGPRVLLAPAGHVHGAVRARRVRCVCVHRRRALRHAVRRRQPSRDRRRGVRRRAVRARRGARAGARPGVGSLRPARVARRTASGPDLPVRVRGHQRGLLRVARASDRDQRRRPGVRPDARRAVLVRVLGRSARLDLATCSSSSRSARTWARSST